MLDFKPEKDMKCAMGKALEQSCPNIPDAGKKAFYKLQGQFNEIETLDWLIRSCFMKNDKEFTDDNVIMRLGDMWPYKYQQMNADYAAQRMFGLLSRSAMLDHMILCVFDLIMGHNRYDSSLLNFAKKYCPKPIRKRIWTELKIKEEFHEPKPDCPHCPHCKTKLKGASLVPRYSCKIDGFDDLKDYRNKRAAHRHIKYGRVGTRLPKYSTIEECIHRILQAMRVVYPDADFTVDWRKRRDRGDRVNRPGEYTHNLNEPFIVQSLKELAILRIRSRHFGRLEGLLQNLTARLEGLKQEFRDIAHRGIKESVGGEIRIVDVAEIADDDDIRAMQAKEDEIRETENSLRYVKEKIDEVCSEIERIRAM